MRLLKRLLCMVAAFALLCPATVAGAAEGRQYSYTVRLFAGQQGSIVGGPGTLSPQGDVLVLKDLPYGARISFYNNMVALEDGSKYYVKGIRQSGKGTEEISETGGVGGRSASFLVTKDQDYVVAYGVLNDPVAYTIHYQDEAGRTLAPSETYYGNVGDKPVVAYQYVEGYQPRAYNLTKTLSADESENVFTFTYTPLPEGTVENITIIEPEGPGAVVVPGEETPTTPAGDEDETPAPPAGEDTQPGGEDAAAPGGGEEEIPDGQVPAAEPREEWDLDDGEVPLAGFEGIEDEPASLLADGKMFWNNIPLPAKLAGGAAMLGGFATALWLLLFRRKRKEEQ